MAEYQVDTPYPRVLSIQSTVVYGYVGNKASVYGLQARQIEVDPLMTCQFSNHTGYKLWRGIKTTGDSLTETIDGLTQNNLLSQYTHIASGYIAEQSFIESLPNVIKLIKKTRQEYALTCPTVQDGRVVYLCDPVLGDNGHKYVPDTFVKVYQDELLPLADIITPNETELKLLAGMDTITSLQDVQEACEKLHQIGPKLIIVTSMKNYPSLPPSPTSSSPQQSQPQSSSSHQQQNEYSIHVPEHTDEMYIRKSIGYPPKIISSTATTTSTSSTTTETTTTTSTISSTTTTTTTPIHSQPEHHSIPKTLDYSYTTPRCLLDTITTNLQPANTLGCFVSYINPTTQQKSQFYIKLPLFDGYIVGTGDLSASLILAHLQQLPHVFSPPTSTSTQPTPSIPSQSPPTTIINDIFDGSNEGFILEAICRALSTIHIVVRATLIRSMVGKHCTTCSYCLSLQRLNPQYPHNLATAPPTAQKQAPIVANLSTEPLELWLTGAHDEFIRPTCTFSPQRL